MHIAIHTGPLSNAHAKRGIGIYTKELIEALVKHKSAHRYSFFTRISEIPKDVDGVHYPFFDPFFLTLPWATPKPTVVTCHDLIPIVYPDHFPRGIRGEIKWQIQKRALAHIALSIITDSQASKNDIEQILQYPKERIFSIPLAPRKVFQPIKDKKILSKLRETYKLNNKFILYVGDINWNKNIPGLLDSVHNLELICVGKAFVDYPTEMPKNARTLGFVSDEDLAGLYSMAQALVCPSFAEGFGFPVLEAMACGCPVVTSNISSLMEIAGPAITVDPYKPEDIRKGIDMILSLSSGARHDMITKGFDWEKRFTWEKVAQDTVAVYEKAFRNNSGL